jgi:acetyl-CoA C-acetyltransferase
MKAYVIDAVRTPSRGDRAMLLGTAIDELERADKQSAVVAMCIGGGQGIATIVERV